MLEENTPPQRISRALHRILERSGLKPGFFSHSIDDGHCEYESGLPGIFVKVTAGGVLAVDSSSGTVEEKLRQAARQINEHVSFDDGAVAKVIRVYDEGEKNNSHNPEAMKGNTLIVDEKFFTSESRLAKFEQFSEHFVLNPVRHISKNEGLSPEQRVIEAGREVIKAIGLTERGVGEIAFNKTNKGLYVQANRNRMMERMPALLMGAAAELNQFFEQKSIADGAVRAAKVYSQDLQQASSVKMPINALVFDMKFFSVVANIEALEQFAENMKSQKKIFQRGG